MSTTFVYEPSRQPQGTWYFPASLKEFGEIVQT